MSTRKSILLILLVINLSCAHHTNTTSNEKAQTIYSNVEDIVDFNKSNEEITSKITEAIIALRKKILSQNDLSILEKIIAYYRMTNSLSQQNILLPPHSKVNHKLSSFCINPNLASPIQNEIFFLKQGAPNIPLSYANILINASKNPNLHNNYQEIIWNLINNVNYEDYPEKSKTILNQIDQKSKYLLPSKFKKVIIKEGKNLIKESILNKTKLGDDWPIIEGKYYNYNELQSIISKRSSSHELPTQPLSQIENNEFIFIESTSNGFQSQNLTFYNSSDSFQTLNLGNYYFSPYRKDVQRIALYSNQAQYKKRSKEIEDTLRDAIVSNSIYWYGGRLTQEELKLIHDYPLESLNVYIQSEKARISVLKYFLQDAEDDESDAFRHFVWSALVTQQLGESLARRFLEAHEALPSKKESNEHTKLARNMDLYNDKMGIEAAKSLNSKNQLSWKKIEEDGLEYLKNGKLKIIKKSQSSRYSDGDKK